MPSGPTVPAIQAQTTGAHCGNVGPTMTPAPCIQWTPNCTNTMPSLSPVDIPSQTGPSAQFSETATVIEGRGEQVFRSTSSSNERIHVVDEVQLRDLPAAPPIPRQVESGMANYGLHEQNPSSLWWPCNRRWPQDPAVTGDQINSTMSLEIAREAEGGTNMEGFWDWDNLIQETYAHLEGSLTA